jgi:hypothetical protein
LVHVPMEFYQLERRGMPSEVAERLREDYRARVSARLERSAAQTRVEQPAPQHSQTAPKREHASPEGGYTPPERGQTAPERGHTAPDRGHTAPEHGHAAPEYRHTAPAREQPASQHERAAPQVEQDPIPSTNMKEIRRRAVQAWLRMRSKEAESSLENGAGKDATVTSGLGDDRSR